MNFDVAHDTKYGKCNFLEFFLRMPKQVINTKFLRTLVEIVTKHFVSLGKYLLLHLCLVSFDDSSSAKKNTERTETPFFY